MGTSQTADNRLLLLFIMVLGVNSKALFAIINHETTFKQPGMQ